jgi:hypothetical protein
MSAPGYLRIEGGTDPGLYAALRIAAFFGVGVTDIWSRLGPRGEGFKKLSPPLTIEPPDESES